MYEEYFGITGRPFPAHASGPAVYQGQQQSRVLAALKKALGWPDAVVALTGPVGSGKTVLVDLALESAGRNRAVARIARLPLARDELLELLLTEFGMSNPPSGRVQRFASFRRLLAGWAQANTRVFVVVEDALYLGAEALIELESLTAADASDLAGVQLVLMGPPELRDALQRPELARLRQRMRLREQLVAMTPAETSDYLGHAFGCVGAQADRILEPAAIKALHARAAGTPRLVNNLCEAAMVVAAENGDPRVSPALIAQIAARQFGPDGADTDDATAASLHESIDDVPHLIQDTLPAVAALADETKPAPWRAEADRMQKLRAKTEHTEPALPILDENGQPRVPMPPAAAPPKAVAPPRVAAPSKPPAPPSSPAAAPKLAAQPITAAPARTAVAPGPAVPAKPPAAPAATATRGPAAAQNPVLQQKAVETPKAAAAARSVPSPKPPPAAMPQRAARTAPSAMRPPGAQAPVPPQTRVPPRAAPPTPVARQDGMARRAEPPKPAFDASQLEPRMPEKLSKRSGSEDTQSVKALEQALLPDTQLLRALEEPAELIPDDAPVPLGLQAEVPSNGRVPTEKLPTLSDSMRLDHTRPPLAPGDGEPTTPVSIPEITLDRKLDEHKQEAAERIAAEAAKRAALAASAAHGLIVDSEEPTDDAALPATPSARQDAPGIDKVAAELGSAKSIEDIDGLAAETLFGEEFSQLAAQVAAMAPPGLGDDATPDAEPVATGSAGAGTPEPERDPPPAPAVSTAPPAARPGPAPAEAPASAGPSKPAPRVPPPADIDESASRRLEMVRALNGNKDVQVPSSAEQIVLEGTSSRPAPPRHDPGPKDRPIENQFGSSMTQTLAALNHKTAAEPAPPATAPAAPSASPPKRGPQPEPIENQFGLSMTQTLNALSARSMSQMADADDDEDVDDDEPRSGFFSRFRRS